MKRPNDFKNIIEKQFEAYCHKVIRNECKSFHMERAAQRKRVVFFGEMSEMELSRLQCVGNSLLAVQPFYVQGYMIELKDEALEEAIRRLPKVTQEIILLYYMLDYNDREISEALGLSRAKVQRVRARALETMRKEWETCYGT